MLAIFQTQMHNTLLHEMFLETQMPKMFNSMLHKMFMETKMPGLFAIRMFMLALVLWDGDAQWVRWKAGWLMVMCLYRFAEYANYPLICAVIYETRVGSIASF